MDPTLDTSSHPHRTPARKFPREPPPSYEVATTTTTVQYDVEQDFAQEDTPLLLAPASHSPPASPRRLRRPARMRREDSHTESLLEALANHPSSSSPVPPVHRVSSYFSPLVKKEYWKAALHLSIINFPFALAAWVYLFVGTLVGTTLLLLLPFGVVIWYGTLIGARAFSRWELALQHKFHIQDDFDRSSSVPYRYQPSIISHTQSPLLSVLQLEAGIGDGTAPPPAYEPSFLQTTYAMFLDPASYQPLFYFIVIKGATTLLMTPIILALLPASVALVLPAPLVLRAIRRVGRWQADLAVEALDWVVVRD